MYLFQVSYFDSSNGVRNVYSVVRNVYIIVLCGMSVRLGEVIMVQCSLKTINRCVVHTLNRVEAGQLLARILLQTISPSSGF